MSRDVTTLVYHYYATFAIRNGLAGWEVPVWISGMIRPPRPMDNAPDTTQLADELHELYLHVVRAYAQLDDVPLNFVQRAALAAIADGGPMRLRELARRIGSTAPTASRAVDQLVELGLAKRYVDPLDRRAVALEPTQRGRARVTRHRRRFADTLTPALAQLDDQDLRELMRTMARLNQALDSLASQDEVALPAASDGRRRR
jgi:DNA-binding MarR family transcriptional regulator